MTTISGECRDASGTLVAGRMVRVCPLDADLVLGSAVSGDGVDIPGDANYANVSLLLNFNQSPFTDSSPTPKTITATGTSGYSDEQKKFGPAAYAGASDRYLTAASHSDFAIGGGDFTIESWLYRLSGTSPSYQTIINVGNYSSGVMFRLQNNLFDVYINNAQFTRSATMANDLWHHVAICRSGTNLRFFLNGVQLGATITNSANIPQGAVVIGTSAHIGGEWVNGYLDDLRFSRVARYTADFTPPTRQFPETASDTPNPLGEYSVDCGSYTDVVVVHEFDPSDLTIRPKAHFSTPA